MCRLVSSTQTSFIKGHKILDNTIIAPEVEHSMKVKKGNKGWMAIKVNLNKFYDRLSL